MTTPKPEATEPAIAEALAEEIEKAVFQAVLAASTYEVVRLPFGECCKRRDEISRIATDRILAALRADPTAGDRGSGETEAHAQRGQLLAKAREQVAYWRERQRQEKCFEDGVSEDGETYTPIGDEAAWQAGYCNGWQGSSAWWLSTIEHLPAPSQETVVAEMGRRIAEAHAELARVFPPPAGNAGTPDPSPLHPHAEGNGHG